MPNKISGKKLKDYNALLDKLKLAKNIALVSHKNPDVDTIGSAAGFYEIVKDNFGGKSIDLICCDKIPEKFKFIKNSEKYKQEFHPRDYDLIIFFDSGSKDQTGFYEVYPELFDGKTYNTVSIDHHTTNELYAKQNILDISYSSTTMIVFEIFALACKKISSISATNLLAGIYVDTGGFRHSNVSEATYFVASKLLELGADYKIVVDKLFRSNKLSTVKLLGKALSNSFVDKNGILYSYISKTELDSCSASYEEASLAANYLSVTEGVKYSILLVQKGEYVKASLRTSRDDVDLTKIAKKFGGGGHKKASGFMIKAQIEEIKSYNLKPLNGKN